MKERQGDRVIVYRDDKTKTRHLSKVKLLKKRLSRLMINRQSEEQQNQSQEDYDDINLQEDYDNINLQLQDEQQEQLQEQQEQLQEQQEQLQEQQLGELLNEQLEEQQDGLQEIQLEDHVEEQEEEMNRLTRMKRLLQRLKDTVSWDNVRLSPRMRRRKRAAAASGKK